MTTLTLKNLPPGLYELLKKRAQANRRSLNNEIIVMLEQSLGVREEITSSVKDMATDYVVTKKDTGVSLGKPQEQQRSLEVQPKDETRVKGSVIASLERSLTENAEIWTELSKH